MFTVSAPNKSNCNYLIHFKIMILFVYFHFQNTVQFLKMFQKLLAKCEKFITFPDQLGKAVDVSKNCPKKANLISKDKAIPVSF